MRLQKLDGGSGNGLETLAGRQVTAARNRCQDRIGDVAVHGLADRDGEQAVFASPDYESWLSYVAKTVVEKIGSGLHRVHTALDHAAIALKLPQCRTGYEVGHCWWMR